MTQDEWHLDDASLAKLYDFLSGVLADPPDAETVEVLCACQLPDPAAAPNERLAGGLSALADWAETVEDPAFEADRLAEEFTRLFVGPRPVLQIHESYYADDFLGEPLAAVKDTYEDLGLVPAPDLKEEVDHAAVELAVFRELTAEGDDRKSAFLREHGEWFVELATDIRESTEERFYEGVADVVAGLITFDETREGIVR